MAKRTIRNTDPEGNPVPTRRRATGEAASTTPKTRGRRQTDGAPVAAAADAAPGAAPTAVSAEAEILDAPTPMMADEITHEHIAVRAYHKFLERGGRPGDQFQDWIAAERELKAQLAGARH